MSIYPTPQTHRLFLLLFFLKLFFLHIPAFGQIETEELGYFHDIIQVHEIDSSTIAIVSNGGTYHVTIYSLDEKEVISNLIRNGRGPGEITQAEASLLEHTDEGTILHVKDFAGKFVSVNLDNEQVVNEVQTTLIQNSHLSRIDGHFIFSKRIVLPALQVAMVDKIDVGYIVDDETFQVADTIRLPAHELDISDTSNLNRLNEGTHIRLDTYLVSLSNDEYLLGVQGNSSLFFFSGGKLSEKAELNVNNTGKIEVVRNDAYGYGLRIPGILNNVYHVDKNKNTVHFSSDQQVIGNSPQIISVSHSQDGLSVEYESLDGADHLSYRLMIYKLSRGYVMHDRAVNRSSYLYLFQ